jgi:hypothetical protein
MLLGVYITTVHIQRSCKKIVVKKYILRRHISAHM